MRTVDPIQILREKLAKCSQAQLARDLGVSPAYLSDVLNRRREPGDGILKPLGLRRKPNQYERIPPSERAGE